MTEVKTKRNIIVTCYIVPKTTFLSYNLNVSGEKAGSEKRPNDERRMGTFGEKPQNDGCGGS